MKKILVLAAGCIILFSCSDKKADDKKTDMTMSDNTTTKAPAALLDRSEGDGIKASFQAFAKGDADGMVASYDDNIRVLWSSGDSVIGKQAAHDFWAGRWNLIKSMSITNDITLPVRVNEPQNVNVDVPGKWVLYWGFIDVTYKNDKNLKFWIHSVNHYNDAGKVDYIANYYDRHPIMEATKDLAK